MSDQAIKAEALREAAEAWGDGTEGFPYRWLLERAAQIEAEGQAAEEPDREQFPHRILTDGTWESL